MKRGLLLLALLTLINVISMKGQNNTYLIQNEPRQCNGYLIMDSNYPNTTSWRISIIRREFDSNGFWSDNTISKTEISGKHYYKIPSEYFEETSTYEFMYLIEGLDANGNITGTQGPNPTIGDGTPWLVGNLFICNGPTFAYGIQQYEHPNGGVYNYSLTSVMAGTDEDNPLYTSYPYYEFMYYDSWEIQSQSYEWLQYHGLNVYDYPTPFGYQNNYRVIQAEEPGAYFNSENEPLNADYDGIVGVQKTPGPWRNIASSICYANGITTDYSTFDIDGILTLFNMHSNINDFIETTDSYYHIDTDLYCPISSSSGTYGSEDNSWSDECFDEITVSDYDEDGDEDGYDVSQQYVDCWTQQWSELVSFDFIEENGNENIHVLHFSEEDLYNANGNITLPSYTLKPGLYSVWYRFRDNTLKRHFYAVEETITSTCPQSALLTATIFPVPIVGDDYNISLESLCPLKFYYQLFDSSANQVYNMKFELGKSSNLVHKVECDKIPEGVLIHKFTFSDGSIKTITTIK